MNGDEPTRATQERALAARAFCEQHPLARVVFSGGNSSLAGQADGRRSEASIMAEIADLPPDIHSIKEDQSNNTLANLLNSAPLLDPDKATGILAHSAQMRRALFLGGMVLPMPPVSVRAEAYGAKREEAVNYLLEAGLLFKEVVSLQGVEPGDIAGIAARAARVEHFRDDLKPVIQRVLSGRSQYS